MKILLTGGGTGGHFYPIIAVARSLREIAEKKRIVKLDLVFMSDDPYDIDLLTREDIVFKKSPAGKLRRYLSLMNFVDIFKTFFGILRALWNLFWDIPDVVFIKGGYASFPALVAAWMFRLPILVHESDVIPGVVNRWAGTFAKRIAISFPETISYFPKKKTALLGNPIRKNIIGGSAIEANKVFELEPNIKTLFILGGSQGAQKINDVILSALPSLVTEYNIVHQCGRANYKQISQRSEVILEESTYKKRYHLAGFLKEGDLRNLSQVTDLIVSRAGAGGIFEIAAWGIPAILVPIEASAGDHQKRNAYAYVKAGAANVIEEKNLKPNILLSEIKKLINNDKKLEEMRISAGHFARIDASQKIAEALIEMGLEHAD